MFDKLWYVHYKKECWERYLNGCSIRRESPKIKDYLSIILNRRNEIAFFDLNVNNVCSLKCKRCDQGMPYLHDRSIFRAESIITNMERLVQMIDYIYQIGIIGGEPFLNNDLDKVINYCVNSEKIGSIIVVTNGTIFPNENILKALQNEKILLGISWYPISNDNNRKSLMEYCERHNIHYVVRKDDWLDFGDFTYSRRYKRKELMTAFRDCFLKNCVQYNNGILYRCTKTHLLLDQNICKPGKNEIINVNEIHTKSAMRKKLRRFYALNYLKACNYCNYGDSLVPIPLGEQLKG